MKRFLTILFLGLATLGSTTAMAQAKFGHINSDELLSLMPETKAAQGQLEKHNKELESTLNTMLEEYQNKMAEFEANQKLMTDVVRDSKYRQLADLEQRIQEFQQTGSQSLQQMEVELLTPILEKAQNAIDAVAKEKGLTYVFDTSKGAVLYAEDSQNLMAPVKSKLGL